MESKTVLIVRPETGSVLGSDRNGSTLFITICIYWKGRVGRKRQTWEETCQLLLHSPHGSRGCGWATPQAGTRGSVCASPVVPLLSQAQWQDAGWEAGQPALELGLRRGSCELFFLRCFTDSPTSCGCDRDSAQQTSSPQPLVHVTSRVAMGVTAGGAPTSPQPPKQQ